LFQWFFKNLEGEKMKTAFFSVPLFASVVVCALTSCAVIGPGDKADAVPPRLVIDSNKVAAWDRPNAFGPVPAELQATGNNTCQQIGAEKATGYHPGALDAEGKPVAGGGYFCVGVKK